MRDRSIRITAASHATFRRLGGDGGGVLLHTESTAYYRLNEWGADIWQIVQEGVTFDELLRRLRALVDGDVPGLEEDLAEFVNELLTCDLVVVEPVS